VVCGPHLWAEGLGRVGVQHGLVLRGRAWDREEGGGQEEGVV
jgi:hypothetical protein